MRLKNIHLLLLFTLLAAVRAPVAIAQAATFTAQVQIHDQLPAKSRQHVSSAGIVLWLTPLQPSTVVPGANRGPFRLVQKNKQFSPHILVVPVGTSVEFPNLDPFFHNVFSLFNGKRFDLGLYEAGTSRSVRFDREGVSYLFCNIHPGMGAIVLALATPYYATSSATGSITIPDIPPGNYQVSVWGEHTKTPPTGAILRTIHMTNSDFQAGLMTLEATPGLMVNHKNKFGQDYAPESASSYKP